MQIACLKAVVRKILAKYFVIQEKDYYIHKGRINRYERRIKKLIAIRKISKQLQEKDQKDNRHKRRDKRRDKRRIGKYKRKGSTISQLLRKNQQIQGRNFSTNKAAQLASYMTVMILNMCYTHHHTIHMHACSNKQIIMSNQLQLLIICMHTCTYTCVCTYTHTKHTYMYTHNTHTCTHTHIRTHT